MDFFIIYVARPALFYRIVAQTPLSTTLPIRGFIVGTMLATFCAFMLSSQWGSSCAAATSRVDHRRAAAATANIGYMGPGLALATPRPDATAPVALIFCFTTFCWSRWLPALMALAGTDKKSLVRNVSM